MTFVSVNAESTVIEIITIIINRNKRINIQYISILKMLVVRITNLSNTSRRSKLKKVNKKHFGVEKQL